MWLSLRLQRKPDGAEEVLGGAEKVKWAFPFEVGELYGGLATTGSAATSAGSTVIGNLVSSISGQKSLR